MLFISMVRLFFCTAMALGISLLYTAPAKSAEPPSSFTYQGKIFGSDGVTPLEAASVTFKIQIRSPDGACLLFEETHLRDMTGTKGVFSLIIGEGSNSHATALSLSQVFDNDAAKSGAAGCSYSPTNGDTRRLRLSFDDSTQVVTLSSDQTLRSVPFAINAMTLQGANKNQFIQVSSQTTQTKIDTLAASETDISSLINGSSSMYAKSSDLPFSAAGLNLSGTGVKVPNTPAGADYAVNKTYVDGKLGGSALNTTGLSDGQSLKWNASLNRWETATPNQGTVVSVTAGNGLAGGTFSNSGTISMPDVGTPGSYFKVTTDTQGRVSSGQSTLLETDIPNLSAAGKVSGNAITSGTIAGSTGISTSGNITTTGNITGANVSATSGNLQNLKVFDSTNSYKTTIKAPAGQSADYSLVLPSGAGSSGQVLSTDGSGNLSWSSSSSGTVTSVAAGAGLSGGTITNSGTISMPNVGTAGSYYKVTTDAQGRVSAGQTSLTETDLPTISTAGKISGSAITSGTIAGSTSINTSGNITTSGTVAAPNVTATTGTVQNLRIFESTNTYKTTIKSAASLAADYNFVLPAGVGSSGQVLTTDGSGNLSWITPTAGIVTSISASAPLAVGGTSAVPSLSISTATTGAVGVVQLASSGGTTAGTVVQASDSRLSDSRAPSGSAGGDLLGSYPNPTVAKIQGVAVSSSTPGNGQWMKYSSTGSTWAAGYISFSDLKTSLGAAQIPNDCTSAQTLVYSSVTDKFACTIIAVASTQVSGLGTAAALDVGTTASKVVQLDSNAKLPAVNGSQLTGIPTFTNGSSVVFDASSSWAPPANVTRVFVQVWGGGGGGAGGTYLGISGGGGGGGGYAADFLTVTPGVAINFTVGAGGAGGAKGAAGTSTNGSNGGTTTFATLSGTGGDGAAVNAYGVANGGVGAGNAGATMTIAGGKGITGNPTAATLSLGAAGGSAGGPGGQGGPGAFSVTGSGGSTGGAPGGGGGGGATSTAAATIGGAGAAGRVVIWY